MSTVRIFSGINSRVFFRGYAAGVFDKERTGLPSDGHIYCFAPRDGMLPALGDCVTETLLEYGYPRSLFIPGEQLLLRGSRLIMSGQVKWGDLADAPFSYMTISSHMPVDRLYELQGGILRPRRLVDISDVLGKH